MSEEIQTTTLPAPDPAASQAPKGFTDRMKSGDLGKTTTTTTMTEGAPTTTTVSTAGTTAPTTSVGTKEPAKAGKKPTRIARGYEHLAVKEPKGITKEDVKEIVTEVGKAMAAETAKAQAAPVEPTDINEEEQYQLEVFAALERYQPDKYKGIVEKSKTFFKDFDDFAAKWEEQHDGQEFDPEGEDATKFRNEHAPRWSTVDFERAKVKLEVEPLQEENKQLRTRLDESARTNTRREIDTMAVNEAIARGKDVATRLDPKLAPELVKIIKADGSFDKELVDRMIADGDVTTEIYIDAIGQAENIAGAAAALFSGVDVSEITLAPKIIAMCQKLDEEIVALPPDQQLDENGRPFAPYPIYAAMKPAQRAKHWSLTADVVSTIAANDIATGAKARAARESERVEAIAKKRGYIKPSAQQQAPAAAVTKKPASPESTASGAPDPGAKIVNEPTPGSFLARMRTGIPAARIK